MRRIVLVSAFALVMTGAGIAQTPTPAPQAWSMPSDAEIRQILVDRIDKRKQSVGLVVGIVDGKGKRIIAYGVLNQGDARALNGDTEFEIGSMTKVFTSLILADMAQHDKVALDDPVQKYLPSSVKMPSRDGIQITLTDLSTHTSGLPRLPTNMKPADSANPYADYTVDQLYQFLNGYTLPRDPGAQFEYSNLGGGLLGHVLALKAGADYETLVHRRITAPLGMADTVITLSPDMRRRLAVGHDAAMQPVKNWDLPTLAGAGALRSTANDMLKFLAAELGMTDTPLNASMARQLSIRRPAAGAGADMSIALGWLVRADPAGTVIWHNGGTGGYRTFMGFDPATQTGVVVLSNAATMAGPDDIGFHLLLGTQLAQQPKIHTEIALDEEAKRAFVGRYQLAPNFILTVTLEDEKLFAQATGQPKFPVFAESPIGFFYKVVDAQLTFTLGEDGKASSLVLHQNGRDIPAQRMN